MSINPETVRKALQEQELKIKAIGYRHGIIEWIQGNHEVNVGLFTIRHVSVVEEDMRSRMRGDGGSNYRTDIYSVERGFGEPVLYYKIRCEFDSWDSYEWDMIEINEVERKTKTITVWEDV